MPVGIKTTDFQTAANLINESRLNSLQGRIAEAIAAERERCAKIAEEMTADIRPFKAGSNYQELMPCRIAERIRSGQER